MADEYGVHAGSGGYLAESTTGEGLASAIDGQLDLVDEWLARVRNLARPLPLGENPVGSAMSEKFTRVAEGGPDSFAAMLESYRAVLESARAAVTESFAGYETYDEQYSTDFGRVAQGGAR